jgi:hypothetical protein
LTAGIAHEIKNPLNFVNNFSALSNELLVELKEMAAPALETLDDDSRADIDETIDMLSGNLEKTPGTASGPTTSSNRCWRIRAGRAASEPGPT